MNNDNTYPILGEPVLLGAKYYKIEKKAVIGKTYTIVCAKCGHHLTVAPKKKGNIEECPQCTAVYAYKAKEAVMVAGKPKPQSDAQKVSGGEDGNEEVKTKKSPSLNTLRHLGMLEWGGFFSKKRATLHEGINIIGRKDDHKPSDISFDDAYMSRQSISIDVAKDNDRSGYKFKLNVQNASNPVIVGSSQLLVGDSVYLNYGDVISLGNTSITFKECKK